MRSPRVLLGRGGARPLRLAHTSPQFHLQFWTITYLRTRDHGELPARRSSRCEDLKAEGE